MSREQNERRLDAFAALLEPMAALLAADDIINAARAGSPLRAVQIAIKDHKDPVISLLAAIDETPVEEYEVPAPMALVVKLLNFFNDPSIADLFTLQAPTETAAAFGPAMDNTQDGAN